MKELLRAKKTTGLGDLFKEYVPQQLEEINLWPQQKTVFRELMEQYHELEKNLRKTAWKVQWADFSKTNAAAMTVAGILTPKQIQLFMDILVGMGEQSPANNFSSASLDAFCNRLIQNSYDAGYNNFTFDYRCENSMCYLGYGLKGKEHQPMNLHLRDAIKDAQRQFSFIEGVDYLNLIVETKYIRHCKDFRHSSMRVKGDASLGFGDRAFCSTFHVENDVQGNFAVSARESIYVIDGNFKDSRPYLWYGSEYLPPLRCTFKSPRKTTVQTLNRNIPSGNRIVHIHSDSEEIVRDYDDLPSD